MKEKDTPKKMDKRNMDRSRKFGCNKASACGKFYKRTVKFFLPYLSLKLDKA